MRNGILWLITVVVGAYMLLLYFGQTAPSESKGQAANTSVELAGLTSDTHPLGQPDDYFPMAIGTTWTYTIAVGDAEPTGYKEIVWPQGDSAMITAERGRFMGLIGIGDQKPPNNFTLTLRVKGPSGDSNPIKWPGVELEAQKDDLHIFESASGIFFLRTADGVFTLVTTYSPDTPGAPQMPGGWGSWGENGHSMRIVFFGEKPMTEESLGEKRSDKLLFDGLAELPEFGRVLHFTRTVDPGKKDIPTTSPSHADDDILDDGFTEDTWFAKGKGLVQLKQTRRNKATMTWTLTGFSQ